jgi:hypothetical protein
MTPKEFKAWFEGFTEAMEGMPTEAQWTKVKARVAQIDGNPTSYPVYVDRYWQRPRPYWESPHWITLQANSSGAASYSVSQPRATLSCSAKDIAEPPFDSQAALFAAGKADFDELSAA